MEIKEEELKKDTYIEQKTVDLENKSQTSIILSLLEIQEQIKKEM